MENIEKLLRLIRENPGMPIIPLVKTEVVSDDSYGYWVASWGCAKVDEYLMAENGNVFLKDTDDMISVLEDYLSYEDFEELPESDDECKPIYDSLPWKKAIIVQIEPFEG